MPIFKERKCFLCVIFSVSQWVNIAHVVGIVQIIYQRVPRLSAMAVMYVRNVIFHFAITALAIQSARKYGERR